MGLLCLPDVLNLFGIGFKFIPCLSIADPEGTCTKGKGRKPEFTQLCYHPVSHSCTSGKVHEVVGQAEMGMREVEDKNAGVFSSFLLLWDEA